jgi:subtilisin family serine protease
LIREQVTRTLAPVVVAVTALMAVMSSDAAASGHRSSGTADTFRGGVVLVGFRPGTNAPRRRAIATAARAKTIRTVGAGTRVMRVDAGGVRQAIARLRQHPEVRYAEPDYVVHATAAPSDPYYRKLWGMDAIRADLAWTSTMGTPAVVVGVVDTGVEYNHPDLAANVWSSAGPINGCPPGTRGYNAINAACDPMDDHRHGTHVSGTISAVGNNGIGVIGVNGTTRIMGLKFLGSGGSGAISDAVEAIDWAVRAKQAGVNLRVLNDSWSGGGFSQALVDAINKAGMNDILFVAAAGNAAGDDDATPFYPCSYHTANEICVAATDKTDRLAGFSKYGQSSVDLAAPGASIYSTMLGGTYDYMSGTSMATPHVSGAAALALSSGYQSV